MAKAYTTRATTSVTTTPLVMAQVSVPAGGYVVFGTLDLELASSPVRVMADVSSTEAGQVSLVGCDIAQQGSLGDEQTTPRHNML